MERSIAIEIITGPIAIALVAYAVGMIALAFLVQPVRLSLVATIDEMLNEPKWNEEQRKQLFNLRDHSMSFLIGLLIPIAVVSVMADEVLGRSEERAPSEEELMADARYPDLVWKFFVSLAAANPIAAVASVLLMIISAVVALAFRRKPARSIVDETIEEPTLRALGRFPTFT